MKTIKKMPSKMRGLGIAGWMLTMIAVVAFATFATKVIPPILEYNTISGIINNAMSDPKLGLMQPAELKAAIERRFGINNIKDVSARDFEITKDTGKMIVKVDYEVRTNLFSNIDVVVVFKEDFERSVR